MLGTIVEVEVAPGNLIAGKYRVERELGRGGMGVVMAAMHTQLNQRVALKFLTERAYRHPEAVARFHREARAAVRIQSEHVARVMDVGTLESGAPYMVMEYLKGRDLGMVSANRGALAVSEAVDYVLHACDAVAEAHSLGIVHRDLKPSNLFLTERPDGTPLVKVLDFGISKALHGSESRQLQMTASAAIMGSPQYMSPEQIRSSKNVDARADVWALGAILHELLAGEPAYQAETIPGLLAMIVADPPQPLSERRSDTPLDLERCVLRCLQKDREQRFSSVSELANALEAFASEDVKMLVRRIARTLAQETSSDVPNGAEREEGNHSGAASSRPSSSPAQTNGSWARARSGSNRAGAVALFKRPPVQLGAALGAGALVILAGALMGRPRDRSETAEKDGSAPVPAQAAPVVRTALKPRPAPLPAPPEPAPSPAPGIALAEAPLAEATGEAPSNTQEANAQEADAPATAAQDRSTTTSPAPGPAPKKPAAPAPAAPRPPRPSASPAPHGAAAPGPASPTPGGSDAPQAAAATPPPPQGDAPAPPVQVAKAPPKAEPTRKGTPTPAKRETEPKPTTKTDPDSALDLFDDTK